MDYLRKVLAISAVALVFSLSIISSAFAAEAEAEYSYVDVQVRDSELEGIPDSSFQVYILNEETEEYEAYEDTVTTDEFGTVNNHPIPVGSTFCLLGSAPEGVVHALSGSDTYNNTWIAVEEKSIKNIDPTAGIGGNELFRSPSPYIHLYAGENPDGVTCLGYGDAETDAEVEEDDSEATEDTEEDSEMEIPTYYEGDAEDFDPETYECADFEDALFIDVEWEGCEAIWYTFLEEVFTGTSEGLIEWDRPINRAEVTKVMIEFFNIPLLEDISEVERFPDVADGVWYTEYIYTARDQGIVQGYGDGYFRPEQTVSRAEMLKIFIETSGITYDDVPSDTTAFTDVVVTEDGPWYIQYANFAFIHGLVDRVDKLYPESAMQRLDAIKLLYRAEEQFGETEGWRSAVSE